MFDGLFIGAMMLLIPATLRIGWELGGIAVELLRRPPRRRTVEPSSTHLFEPPPRAWEAR